MTCYDARRKLSALLDGAVSAPLRDALARHVDGCASCRADLDALAGTDRVVRKGLGLASVAAMPANYFEDFWTRLGARLDAEHLEEDPMAMSTDRPADDQPAPESTSTGTDVAGKPISKSEVSGLHDIRALAASTIDRTKERRATEPGLDDGMLESASPAALGQVVLPAPGREVAPPVVQLAAAAPGGARASGSRGVVVAIAGVVIAAAAAVVFVMMRKTSSPDTVAATTASEKAPARPAPAPAPAAALRAIEEEEARPGVVPPPPSAVETEGGAPAVAAVTPPKDPKAPAAGPAGKPVATAKDPAKDPEKPTPAPGGAAEPKKPTDVAPPPADTKPAEPRSDMDRELDDILGQGNAKPEEPKPAEPEASALPEKLSADQIKKGMGQARARVQACYDKYKVAGTVTIKVKIEPDGTVSAADAVDEKFANTETGLCVSQAVSVVKFPEVSGPALSVKYKFKLE